MLQIALLGVRHCTRRLASEPRSKRFQNIRFLGTIREGVTDFPTRATYKVVSMEWESLFTNRIVLLLMTSLMMTGYALKVDGRYEFVKNASNAPGFAEYDYIIVGGGTAGCPLAATLSSKFKVLLLERGGAPFDKLNVVSAYGFAKLLSDIDDKSISPAQGFQSQEGVLNRRARVLGGGSSINAGFYSRPEVSWINDRNLTWSRVNESFQWVESTMISFPSVGPWQTAVKEALLQTGVGPYNGYTYDHAIGVKIGGTTFDHTGHRRSAADLLQFANPNNISVYTYASVNRLEFELHADKSKPKTTGVIYTDENGDEHQAVLSSACGSEVILTAGALGSPQLLMLSGIGPADHLKDLGIPVVLNQPSVGDGMADNPCVSMLIPSLTPLEPSLVSTVGILPSGFYIEAASGAAEAFHEVQHLNVLDPQYRSEELVLNYTAMLSHFPPEAIIGIARSGVLVGKIGRPVSRGSMRLKSTDVRQNPLVQFNYFGDLHDLYACVEGVKVMVQLLEASSFKKIKYPKLPEAIVTWARFVAPLAPDTSDLSLLAQWCRSTVLTIWHFHGGALEGVVVDNSYKFMGVDALRIIDGSTFNTSPGTNPQATVLMLGRYMGLEILDERARSDLIAAGK